MIFRELGSYSHCYQRNSLNLLILQLKVLHSANSIQHTHSRVGVLVHNITAMYMWRPDPPRAVNLPSKGEACSTVFFPDTS